MKFLGLFLNSLGRIFGTVFGQFRLNFWDCFGTVQAEFSGLCLDSLDRISGLFSGSSGLIFGLCVCCFSYVSLKKFELHVGCVKIMLMHAYECIDMEFMMDVNYM